MLLEREDGDPIEDPTAAEVVTVLEGLDADGERFAILQREPSHYLQTYAGDGGDFELEYREGSADQHFTTAEERPLAEVVEAFLSYLADDNKWRTAFEWERLEL